MLSKQISKVFGVIADKEFPPPIQKIINNSYAKLFDIDFSEHDPIESYPSLNKLFTRKLKQKRLFSKDGSDFISPADCRVKNYGTIKNGQILQIKGRYYSVAELLNSSQKARELEDGSFINLYLSPRDYHRFHAPCDATVLYAFYIPGKLYPVNDPAISSVDGLFAKNERVVVALQASFGVFYMVFVGALNVGRIVIEWDEKIKTNSNKKSVYEYRYGNIHLKKGDEIGRFEMGSSIAILFGKGQIKFLCSEGEKIRFGDTIGKTE